MKRARGGGEIISKPGSKPRLLHIRLINLIRCLHVIKSKIISHIYIICHLPKYKCEDTISVVLSVIHIIPETDHQLVINNKKHEEYHNFWHDFD